jgi:carboxypeptidase Taq
MWYVFLLAMFIGIKFIAYLQKTGRLDVSPHPFTGGAHATDVRMTTRYRDDDLIEGITGTVHETGHALYEQGRNAEYVDLPVSEAMSMGIHESQSLLWERMVGLSEEFWQHYWPVVVEHFPDLNGVTADQFYRAINESRPGFIRY